jgi:Mg2+-importing ATPase
VNTTSFFFAYAVSLALALTVLFIFGRDNVFIVSSSIGFMVVSVALGLGITVLSGKDIGRRIGRLNRFRMVRNVVGMMKDADSAIVRETRLQLAAAGYQFLTFLLDALTLWALIRSMGEVANVGYIFSSFMIANLVRTVGIVPGGLGTFEAVAVMMLRRGGLSVAVALSATLLFRAVTFVLPMIPGLWFSRRLPRQRAHY